MSNRVKKRTYKNIAKRYLARASGATLGFIAGNVPGAVYGQHYAGRAIDYVEPDEIVLPTKMSRSSGFYKGSAPRARYVKKTLENVALQKGFHGVFDTYGRIVDPQAAYIMHSTWSASHFGQIIIGAMYRKLFQKAGIQINERIEELPLASISSAVGFRLEFTVQNAVNSAGATYTYDTVEDDTLQSVIGAFAGVVTFFNNYFNNITAAVASEPYRLSLYSLDGAVWRLASTLNLQNEFIDLFVSSELNMQNRTSGDLAAAGDAAVERVDNQPLMCKIYEFSHADPRLRQNNAATDALNTAGVNGIKLIRGIELPLTFQHRPSPKIWLNCKGSSQFILDPGNLKKTFIQWKIKGMFINVLKKLKCYTTAANGLSGGIGKCQIVMFEEKLRTSGSNNLTIQYEQVMKVGCWMTTKAGGALHSFLSETTLSNP